jgi:hypothetical protein
MPAHERTVHGCGNVQIDGTTETAHKLENLGREKTGAFNPCAPLAQLAECSQPGHTGPARPWNRATAGSGRLPPVQRGAPQLPQAKPNKPGLLLLWAWPAAARPPPLWAGQHERGGGCGGSAALQRTRASDGAGRTAR